MTHYKPYPFTAIIGQDSMKLGLILNAINPTIGGILIKGMKGSAKSTAVRALADLLPEIKVMRGCPFNCNPANLKESCHECQQKILQNTINPEEIVVKKMRVINLPINSTEDRVVGTIDIKVALNQGIKSLEPGILAEANRNILYIDEINLLSDNVADVLLDSAAMGVNIIEREGISLHHPSNFILIGTMNPEEGNLRPQLLDRFGLSADMERIENIQDRVKIIEYSEEYHENPEKFYNKFKQSQTALRKKIVQARALLESVTISSLDLARIARICVAFQTDGHRADITIARTAKTIAAFENRRDVQKEDIKKAVKLALIHRLRRLPFEDENFDENKLDELLDEVPFQEESSQEEPFQEESQEDSSQEDPSQEDSYSEEPSPEDLSGENPSPDHPQDNKQTLGEESFPRENFSELEKPPENANSQNLPLQQSMAMSETQEKIFDTGDLVDTTPLVIPKKTREFMKTSGPKILHPTMDKRGKYVGGVRNNNIANAFNSDVAVNETINSALLEPQNSHAIATGNPIKITEDHIVIKKRQGKSSNLIIFCVDASGSMGVDNQMETVKGTIFSILQNNYIHRDKVCLIIFRKDKAELVLPPTRSIDLAYKLLQEIPTGGTTPLVSGLIKALEIAQEEKRKDTGYIPLLILITDARSNVFFNDSMKDVKLMARSIAEAELGMIVIDTENSEIQLGLCKDLAETANAAYYHILEFTQQMFTKILSKEGIYHG